MTLWPPMRVVRFLSVLSLLSLSQVLFVPAAFGQEATTPDPTTLARRASVYLMQTYTQGENQILSCVGSGTLISANGLILTNAHLVEDTGPCRGDRIIVALPVRLEDSPIPTYLAEPVLIDRSLDIAVIQIRGGLDGSAIASSTLSLPFVSVGDPAALQPGAALTAIGYPDTGESSTVVVPAPLSAVISEAAGGSIAWYQTTAVLGGVMSGGGVFNPDGQLIGVITSASGTDGSEHSPTCLSIQDTNHDGGITAEDACVPIGAPATAIRPITLAIPEIETARRELHPVRVSGVAEALFATAPSISRMYFSPGISETGIATQVTNTLPGGATAAYVFFDFANIPPGTSYDLRATRDGLEVPEWSIGPLAWPGGVRGTWYIGKNDVALSDGRYEFTLRLNGSTAATATLTVGPAQPEPGIFSNLSFSTTDGVTGRVFPAEVQQINASFDFSGMPAEQVWTEVWYLDGTEVSSNTRLWDNGDSGRLTVSAINLDGLPLGVYRLELFVGERLAATGDVTLVGNRTPQGEPQVFSNARMANAISPDNLPAGTVGTVMPLGTTSLYAFVDWDMMPRSTTWTHRWYLDGRLITNTVDSWDAGSVGQNYWIGLTSDRALPEGTYSVEVLVGNKPMFSQTVSIGSGTAVTTGQDTQADDVFISGTVVDAITGEGIPGALVFVLDVEFESAQFLYDESQIQTQTITDQQGRFSLAQGLRRGNYFTVYVFADGYITVLEDTFIVSRDQASPAEIRIVMSRP
ncbi:MAG: trypsin-like peptidase domain-containing protein [Anaerolineae bacterium]|nr:trypsin-like peptidase domain-containing protein [Anaerolineae bacterium]